MKSQQRVRAFPLWLAAGCLCCWLAPAGGQLGGFGGPLSGPEGAGPHLLGAGQLQAAAAAAAAAGGSQQQLMSHMLPAPGSDQVCGLNMKELRHERIVGGRSTSYAEVPFIAHLRESQLFRVLGYNKCGGVLLNHRWVLTAAHCKPAYFSSLEIILGKHRTFEDAAPPEGSAMAAIVRITGQAKRAPRSGQPPLAQLGPAEASNPNLNPNPNPNHNHNPDPGRSMSAEQQAAAEQQLANNNNINMNLNELALDRKQPVMQLLADTVIVHPDYEARTLENDLALVRLKTPVPYRDDVQPICLPAFDEDFTGLDGYATGWGLTDFEKRQLPDTLQIVRLPVIANKRCQAMYRKAGHDKLITEMDLCAGYAKGGMDACEGDSGGPLIVRRPHDHRWTLAGIVSNGVKCGEPLLPGVYTRVSKFVHWIQDQMRLHA